MNATTPTTNPPLPTIHSAEVLPPRAVIFLGIVALHALLIYFIGKNLGVIVDILKPPVIQLVPTTPRETVEPTPSEKPPEPTMSTIREAFVPEPDVPINEPADVVPGAITARFADENLLPDAGPTIAPPEPPLRIVGRHVMPNTAEYYPPSEIRAEHEGTAEVSACVAPNGKLSGSPTVERSSGRTALDNAAVRVVRDGRFAKAMRGDEPVPNCYRFRITFALDGR